MTGDEIRHLRRLAHDLKPVVMVGKSGLTEGLVGSIVEALAAHELIKVRFVEFKDQRRDLTERMAKSSDSDVVGLIGNVAILYRPHPDPAKRKVGVTAGAPAPSGSREAGERGGRARAMGSGGERERGRRTKAKGSGGEGGQMRQARLRGGPPEGARRRRGPR